MANIKALGIVGLRVLHIVLHNAGLFTLSDPKGWTVFIQGA
jgi:hypothetical protein